METEMRALIVALAGGLALVASTQAAPLVPNPASIELGAAPPVELIRDPLWTRLAPNPLARSMG